jgi:hypothetical protein
MALGVKLGAIKWKLVEIGRNLATQIISIYFYLFPLISNILMTFSGSNPIIFALFKVMCYTSLQLI